MAQIYPLQILIASLAGNELVDGRSVAGSGAVECTDRLGGLLKFYRRAA